MKTPLRIVYNFEQGSVEDALRTSVEVEYETGMTPAVIIVGDEYALHYDSDDAKAVYDRELELSDYIAKHKQDL